MSELVPTETRLSKLEEALRINERLESLEKAFREKTGATQRLPWWRNSKTVTILAAMIAAVLPLLTFIDGSLKNTREAQRLLAEQQDKIRQNYLDRVLKPGITEAEQARLFNLLAKLKTDPEFQQWAQDELTAANQKVELLVKEKARIEAERQQILAALTDVGVQFDQDVTTQDLKKIQQNPTVKKLETDLADTQQRVTELKERVGEPGQTGDYVVTLLTQPSGARVRLSRVGGADINSFGTTPFKARLNWGIYKATFEYTDYRTVSRFINVTRDTETSISLEPIKE